MVVCILYDRQVSSGAVQKLCAVASPVLLWTLQVASAAHFAFCRVLHIYICAHVGCKAGLFVLGMCVCVKYICVWLGASAGVGT